MGGPVESIYTSETVQDTASVRGTTMTNRPIGNHTRIESTLDPLPNP